MKNETVLQFCFSFAENILFTLDEGLHCWIVAGGVKNLWTNILILKFIILQISHLVLINIYAEVILLIKLVLDLCSFSRLTRLCPQYLYQASKSQYIIIFWIIKVFWKQKNRIDVKTISLCVCRIVLDLVSCLCCLECYAWRALKCNYIAIENIS